MDLANFFQNKITERKQGVGRTLVVRHKNKEQIAVNYSIVRAGIFGPFGDMSDSFLRDRQ